MLYAVYSVMMEKVLIHISDVSQGYIVWYIVTNISEECVASLFKALNTVTSTQTVMLYMLCFCHRNKTACW